MTPICAIAMVLILLCTLITTPGPDRSGDRDAPEAPYTGGYALPPAGYVEAGSDTAGSRAGLTTEMRLLDDFDLLYYGSDAVDYCGHDMVMADIDQDGFDDIIVSSYAGDGYLDERSNAGQVQVLFGRNQTLKGTEIDLTFHDPDMLITAPNAGDLFGVSLAVGDINGDGYPDIVGGAYGGDGHPNNRYSSGDVIVYYGRPRAELPKLVDLQVSADVIIYGNNSYDYGGIDIAVGNVNGDSFDDIIIGSYGGDGPANARYAAGEVYVVLGNGTMPYQVDLDNRTQRAHQDCVIYGEYNYDYAGRSVGCADLDGDGLDEILVGAYGRDPAGRPVAGAVYVVWGNYTWPWTIDLQNRSHSTATWGANSYDYMATTLTGGDIDKDGYDDLMIGCIYGDGPMNSRSNGGEVIVLYGKERGSWPALIDLGVSDADFYVYGAGPSDYATTYISTGDLNGDGYADIFVGASNADGEGDANSNSGECYVVLGDERAELGPNSDLATDAAYTIYGRNVDDALDTIKCGDYDGDGLMDLVLGAPLAKGVMETNDDAGEVYVIHQGIAPMRVKSARITDGRGEGGRVIYAGGGAFTFEVNVTDPQGRGDLDEVTMVIDPDGYAAGVTYSASLKTFSEVPGTDPDKLVTLSSDPDTDALQVGGHSATVLFRIALDWGFGGEGLLDVEVTASGITAPTANRRFSGVFQVNEELEFTGNITVWGDRQGRLAPGDWVAADEQITVMDFMVVYRDSDGLQPGDELYSVAVTDQDGRSRTNDTNPPGPMSIAIPAVNTTTDQGRISLRIQGIPPECDVSNWSFRVNVDADPPPAPPLITFHPDSLLEDANAHDDDSELFAAWDPSVDVTGGVEGSGVAGYYYAFDDAGGTRKGTWTKENSAALHNVSEGVTSLYVWAKDRVGNIGPSSSAAFRVDLTDPVLESFLPGTGQWVRNVTVPLYVNISDAGGSGVDASTVEYRVSTTGMDKGDFQAWTLFGEGEDGEYLDATATELLAEGMDNHVQWRFKDLAGNGPVVSEPLNIWVDSLPVTFRDPVPSEEMVVPSSTVQASVVVEDILGSGVDVDNVQYRYTTSGLNASVGEWTSEGLTMQLLDAGARSVALLVSLELDGGDDNHIQWRTKDIAGNGWTGSPSYQIRVNRPPTPKISSPQVTDIFSTTDTIFFNGNRTSDLDGDTLSFFWTSNITGPLSNNVSFRAQLPAGLHQVRVYVNDGHGHNESTALTVRVETPPGTPPTGDGGDGVDGGTTKAGGDGDESSLSIWLVVVLLVVLIIMALLFVKYRKSRKLIDEHFEKVDGEMRLKRTTIEAELISEGLVPSATLAAQPVPSASLLPRPATPGEPAGAATPASLLLSSGSPPGGTEDDEEAEEMEPLDIEATPVTPTPRPAPAVPVARAVDGKGDSPEDGSATAPKPGPTPEAAEKLGVLPDDEGGAPPVDLPKAKGTPAARAAPATPVPKAGPGSSAAPAKAKVRPRPRPRAKKKD